MPKAELMMIVVGEEALSETRAGLQEQIDAGEVGVITWQKFSRMITARLKPSMDKLREIQKAIDEALSTVTEEKKQEEGPVLEMYDPPDPQEIAKAARKTWHKNGTGNSNPAQPGERK